MKKKMGVFRSLLRRFISNVKGTTAVEYALVLPFFLSFVLGAIDFGMLMFGRLTLEYATTQTARYAYVHKTAAISEIQNYGLSLSAKKTNNSVFTYEIDTDPDVSATITGKLTYTYFFLPLAPVTMTSVIVQPIS